MASSAFVQIELLDRVVDSEYGLVAYPRRSSLAGYQCQCGIIDPPTVVQWKNVPFLWGYQILSMPPIPPMVYPWFDHFRDCYTSKAVYTGTITEQPVTFQAMGGKPNQSKETLLDNCFDEDQTATLYTIHLPSHPPVVFLYRHSSIFEVKLLYTQH